MIKKIKNKNVIRPEGVSVGRSDESIKAIGKF